VSAAQTEESALLLAADLGDVAALQTALATSSDRKFVELARLVLASSKLQAKDTHAALAAYLATGDLNERHRALAWSMVAGQAFADNDYKGAAKASRHWLALLSKNDPTHQASDASQLLSIATLLIGAPRQKLLEQHPTTIPLKRDAAGLLRAQTLINGIAQEAVLDTGADLPVVSLSTARRLHLGMLAGSGTVGSSTRKAVDVRIAVADRLELAGSTLLHVPFLVLDDEQLELPLPGGYRIEAIIGFPVFRAMGRVTFAENGTFAAGFPDTHAQPLDDLRVFGSSLFVSMTLGNIPIALQLDTGAPQSSLSVAFSHAHLPLVQGLQHTVQRSAGAGGSTEHTVGIWRSVPISIGGGTTLLPELDVEIEGAPDVPTHSLGRLGQDILRAFSSFTLDLRTMSLTVGPTAETSPAATSVP
jgi:hypothetical protein